LNLKTLVASQLGMAKSKSARAAMIYMTSTSLNLGIPFLLLPILTRYLEPSDYGRAAMFQGIVSISNTITGFSLRYPLLRAFSVGPNEDRPAYLSSILSLVAGISCLLILSMLVLNDWISELTGLPTIWTLTAVLTGMATTIYQCRLTVFQADNRSVAYGMFQNSATVLNMAMSVLLVVGFGLHWIGRTSALTFATWAIALVSLVAFYRSGLFAMPTRKITREALTLGAAAIPHAAAGVLLSYADRFFLSEQYSMHEVGTYALASQLGMVIMMLGLAMNTALSPWAYRKLSKLETAAEYRGLIRIVATLLVGLTAGTLLYYVAVILAFNIVVPSKYNDALIYFPWLLGAAYFNAIYFIFVSPIFYYKKTKILAASGMFNLVFSLSMFFVLSRYFGPLGVAIAMCCARFILFATALTFGVKLVVEQARSHEEKPVE
jgi:O-antigen/teichoic acid export membrane protein